MGRGISFCSCRTAEARAFQPIQPLPHPPNPPVLGRSAAASSGTARRGGPCEGDRPRGWPGLSRTPARTPPISEEPLRGAGGWGNRLLVVTDDDGVAVVVNSRSHTQSGQEMDQIRLCDIGRRNVGPAVRSVDRVLKDSSEVGEKADYPVNQPCKKETDGVHVYSHWLSPLSFSLSSSIRRFSRRRPIFART